MKTNKIFTIPNIITSFNLLCGCIAVIIAFESPGNMYYSAFLIGLASVFDFLDGMAARLLNAYSDIGKELDSLADLVSFGFAPAAIVFQLMKTALFPATTELSFHTISILQMLLLLSPFFITVFSALRLAKFNIDTRQTESFIGLATPANAIFWGSFPVVLYYADWHFFADLCGKSYFLLLLICVTSFLLIGEIPMFSLKFKNLSFQNNHIRYIFLTLSLLLFIVLGLPSFLFIIILYILISLINIFITKTKKNNSRL